MVLRRVRARWPVLPALVLLAMGSAMCSAERPSSSPEAIAEAQQAMERGIEARTRGELTLAVAEYRRAASLVPDANLPHRYAAEALVELGRREEAIASYETYLRIRPNVQDAPDVRARLTELRSP
jgi:tetratricopeptide (TPR) repeat protein